MLQISTNEIFKILSLINNWKLIKKQSNIHKERKPLIFRKIQKKNNEALVHEKGFLINAKNKKN
ncbi:hypothetical protein BKM32_06575 [Mangrovimonas sp. DI 80]|nr:hypothetical protein BKM32_06575 [Mangrovimonas sp. DI 80]